MIKEFVFMRNVIIKKKEYIVKYCSEDIKNGRSSEFSLVDINLVFIKVSKQYIFNKRYFCNMCFKKLILSIFVCIPRKGVKRLSTVHRTVKIYCIYKTGELLITPGLLSTTSFWLFLTYIVAIALR